jgi:predicted ATPase/DNA-binding CsgD family transcriptional regulator
MSQPGSLDDQPLIEALTARELEILEHLAANRSNREIADALTVSLNTVKWYNRQIYGKLGVNDRRQAVSRARGLGLLPATHPQVQTPGTPPSVRRPTPVYNLPASPTPFFGRASELAALEAMLADPATRLVTLTGPGGSGKTRLALEAGVRVAERDRQALADGLPLAFPHGITFVPLAAVDSAEGIVPVLADALGLRLQGGPEQLIEALRRRQVLLILDNLEHLLAGVEFLAEILRTAPGVQILATSREQLQLLAEHVLPIGGLPYPESDLSASSPEAADVDAFVAIHPALQLLVESARRVQPRLALTAEDLPILLDICREVDGLPLALELTASWANTLSLSDILAETQQSLSFLEAKWHDVPERHRSMRAVFDASCRRLLPEQRATFYSLSVFRGGFTREAAGQVVAGAKAIPHLLATLVRKSFLQYDQARDRYGIHELLRQYGAENLAQEPAREAETRDRHSDYYTRALEVYLTHLKGPQQPAILARMEADRENFRAAWNRAADKLQLERLDGSMEALALFYWWRGPFADGGTAFRRAATSLAAVGNQLPAASGQGPSLSIRAGINVNSAQGHRVLARALAWWSNFCRLTGNRDQARAIQQQSLAILQSPGLAGQDTRREEALLLGLMGITLARSDDERARHFLQQSLDLHQELDDRWGMANMLECLGGQARLKESLALFQTLGHAPSIARIRAGLADIALRQGQFREAERLARESSATCRELEDRPELAYCLLSWGASLEKLGRFAEARSALEESLAIYGDLGKPHLLVSAYAALSSAELHLGCYKEAQLLARTALARGRKADTRHAIGRALLLLGCVALAEGAAAEAQRLLQESVAVFKEIGDPIDLGWAIAVSSYAELSMERTSQARQLICETLRALEEIRTLEPYLYALPAAALLFNDEGEKERAVELHALASRYPLVAKSRWFADVAGNTLSAVAATLPAERVAILKERGKNRDLEATAAELLAELCRQGSPSSSTPAMT